MDIRDIRMEIQNGILGNFPSQVVRGIEALIDKKIEDKANSDGWQDFSTAPRDGTEFDAWCVHPDGNREIQYGIRIENVRMRGDLSGFGFIVHLREGTMWQYLDARNEDAFLPAWIPTHWRAKPNAPKS